MGKGKRVTVRRSAEEWRAIMSRFERSGRTHGQFCAAEDLAPSTFSLWRRKLRRPVPGREANGAARFVELADSPAPSSAWDAELDLGEGVVLRLRRVSRCRTWAGIAAFGCTRRRATCAVPSTGSRRWCATSWDAIPRTGTGTCS